jgi:hypothetical protein
MACPACYLNSLQTFTPPLPVKRREAGSSFSQPQPAPYSQTSSGNGFWWVVGVIAVIFLIIIFNSDKKPAPTNTPPVVTTPAPVITPPVVEPAPATNTPTETQQQSTSNQYISLFASNSRAIGYSIGNSSESNAKSDAYQQCTEQVTEANDTCVLVLSGKGRCLAISRSTDGAIGVSIGSSPISTATQAQTACKNNGGGNCPHPTDTTFCSN